MELREVEQTFVEVFYKDVLFYRGFLLSMENIEDSGENFVVCGVNGETFIIPMDDSDWDVVPVEIGDPVSPWKLIKKEFSVICTEKTAYEMFSAGFFSGFFIGFLLFLLFCILFF